MPLRRARPFDLSHSTRSASPKPKRRKRMKHSILTSLSAVILFAALAIPIRLAGQEQSTAQEGKKEQHRYKLIDVGTFGGPNSYFVNLFFPLTNNGLATGTADTAIAVGPSSCF